MHSNSLFRSMYCSIWTCVATICLSGYNKFLTVLPIQQMYRSLLMEVCQWWHWMKQARSESLGADQHWDLVKWSLVTLCSTGEVEPPLTSLTQCLALIQPHTPSPTSILVQYVYEVRVASAGPLGRSRYCCYTGKHITTYDREWAAKLQHKWPVYWLWFTTSHDKSKLMTQILVYSLICIADFRCQLFLHELRYCNSVSIMWHTAWHPVQSSLFI